MQYTLYTSLLAGSLFVGMLILLEVGRRVGVRQLTRDPDGAHTGLGAIDGAVFDLLGLICSRPMYSRPCMTVFAAISTPAEQSINSHLSPRRKQRSPRLMRCRERSGAKESPLRGRRTRIPTRVLLLPALNDMIDITSPRTLATPMHPPSILFVMLFGLAFTSALLAGYGMAGSKYRRWLHSLCFAAAAAVAVYVILDLEYPRLGSIRIDAFDQAPRDLRESMK